MTSPCPLYDTRLNINRGIEWHGWLYESCPQLRTKRVMIVEDHGDYLIVSDYSKPCGWRDKCKPVEPMYRVNRIATGRPTKNRIGRLQTAIKELQNNL